MLSCEDCHDNRVRYTLTVGPGLCEAGVQNWWNSAVRTTLPSVPINSQLAHKHTQQLQNLRAGGNRQDEGWFKTHGGCGVHACAAWICVVCIRHMLYVHVCYIPLPFHWERLNFNYCFALLSPVLNCQPKSRRAFPAHLISFPYHCCYCAKVLFVLSTALCLFIIPPSWLSHRGDFSKQLHKVRARTQFWAMPLPCMFFAFEQRCPILPWTLANCTNFRGKREEEMFVIFFLKRSVATITKPTATDHLQSSLLSVWKMRTTCNTEMPQENYTNILSVACCVTKDQLGCLFHCTWRNYENTRSRRAFSQSHFRQWSCSSVEVRCSSWGPRESKAKCDTTLPAAAVSICLHWFPNVSQNEDCFSHGFLETY